MKLTNGATVLRASINFERGDVPTAVVLAKRGDFEFVTWNAYLRKGETEWDAEVGHYFNIREPIENASNIEIAHDEALADFHERTARR